MLSEGLAEVSLASQGWRDFRDYLHAYSASEKFCTLEADIQTTEAALRTVHYCVHIQGDSVRVRRCEDEVDYTTEVERTFAKFKQGDVKNYHTSTYSRTSMNHVEAQFWIVWSNCTPRCLRNWMLFSLATRNFWML